MSEDQKKWIEEYFDPLVLAVTTINLKLRSGGQLTAEQTKYLNNLRFVLPVLDRLNTETGLTIDSALNFDVTKKSNSPIPAPAPTQIRDLQQVKPVQTAPTNLAQFNYMYKQTPPVPKISDKPDDDKPGDEKVAEFLKESLNNIRNHNDKLWAVYTLQDNLDSEEEESEEESEEDYTSKNNSPTIHDTASTYSSEEDVKNTQNPNSQDEAVNFANSILSY